MDQSSLSHSPKPHKGWRLHGYLPHFDQPGLIQGITYRLADALPAQVVALLAEELDENTSAEKRARVETRTHTVHVRCVTPGLDNWSKTPFCILTGCATVCLPEW